MPITIALQPGIASQMAANQVYALPYKTLYFYPYSNLQSSDDQSTWTAVTGNGVKAKFVKSGISQLVMVKSA